MKCEITHTLSHSHIGNIMKTGKNKFFLKYTRDQHYANLQEQLWELSKSGYLSVKKCIEEHADEYEISPGWEAEVTATGFEPTTT